MLYIAKPLHAVEADAGNRNDSEQGYGPRGNSRMTGGEEPAPEDEQNYDGRHSEDDPSNAAWNAARSEPA
jgi:hypothetical protein